MHLLSASIFALVSAILCGLYAVPLQPMDLQRCNDGSTDCGQTLIDAAAKAKIHTPHAEIRYLGSFAVPGAAFTHIQALSAQEPNRLALFVQAFPLDLPSTITVVPDIGSKLSQIPDLKPQLLTDEIVWPNGLTTTANETIRGGPQLGFVVASGFIPPIVATGAIHFVDLDRYTETGNVRIYKLTRDKFQYFYHRTIWVDCDGDGIKDLMTARAFTYTPDGELLCLLQPRIDPLINVPWKELIISKSPDVHFDLADIKKDGGQHVASATFFSNKVELVVKNGPLWSNTDKIKNVLIDPDSGNPFDVIIADLNNDGKNDLLVSNHESVAEKTALYAYEIPDNLEDAAGYKRHYLGGGFPVTTPGDNQASPGAPKIFYPNTRQTSGKPWILLSGDAAQEVYLFTPKSESPSDWEYDYYPVFNTGGTTGEVAVADLDGDGWVEFFLPDYDNGNVHAFTFAP